MDARELHVTLDLRRQEWALALEARSEVIGQVRIDPIPLPFSPQELSIFERALDLNADVGLTRLFRAEELERLAQWQLLRHPTQPFIDASLGGRDLYRDRLRHRIRDLLAQVLLNPLQEYLDGHFAALRAQSGGKRPLLSLRLQMWPGDLDLFRLPWELLHGHRLPQGELQVARYILYNNVPGLPPPAPRLRLLVIHSDPADAGLPRLDLHDHARIVEGLKGTTNGARFDLEPIEPGVLRTLQDALIAAGEHPTIVHFAGHGDFGWRCAECGRMAHGLDESPCGRTDCHLDRGRPPEGALAFTHPETGAPDWIGVEGLCDVLKLAGDLRLVVLGACKSATGRRGEDVFNGIAQRLMDIVPAVVATPYPLATDAAEEFARCLYRGLGNGLSLVAALHQARLLMREPYPDDWYRPVLYFRGSQADGGRLLAVPSDAEEQRAPAQAFAGPEPHRRVPDRVRSTLKKALEALSEDFEAAYNQSIDDPNAVTRNQAKRNAEAIERQMRKIQEKLR
jgi:hypothetical protein